MSADARLEVLRNRVSALLLDLRLVIAEVDDGEAALGPFFRSSLGMQIQSLLRVHSDLGTGTLSRRHWSLCLAAMPVLSSLLNAVRAEANSTAGQAVDRCRESIGVLQAELMDFAEGR